MAAPDPRIAVFGAGAIGCFVGGLLKASGNDVFFVGRKEKRDEIKRSGMKLTDLDGAFKSVSSDAICWKLLPDDLDQADIVLFCVKSTATRAAAVEISGHLRKGALVVSLQNGVENDQILRDVLPECEVVGGMVAFNVVSLESAHFHRSTDGKITLEARPGTNYLTGLLREAGIEAEDTTDFESAKWGKLLLNLNNGLNVISGVPLVEQLSNRDHRVVLSAAMKEALMVMKKARIRPAAVGNAPPALSALILTLPDWLFKKAAARMLAMDVSARASMWDDLQRGRNPEINQLNGAIVSLGIITGIKTPVNQAIVDLVNQAFSNGKSQNLSGKALRRRLAI